MRKLWAFFIAVLCLLCGCSAQTSPVTKSGFGLDTVVSVTVYGQPESSANAALSAAFAELERLEALLSATRETSDISRINKANGAAVTVAPETAEVLALGLRIGEASGGAFDITVRPLSVLWDFGGDAHVVPSKDALAAACELVDYRNLTVNGTAVTLKTGGLEPGGIAKGYIADCLRETLEQQNVTSALIDLGGNIVAHGSKSGGDWRIGIKDPQNPSALAAIVCGQDFSVVTSGIYERGFTLDGVRYHHLLDPKTGMPVQNGLASVTVITQSSALADALSTACFVLGETKARELLKQFPEAEALFVYENGTLSATDGLPCVGEGDIPEYKFTSFS